MILANLSISPSLSLLHVKPRTSAKPTASTTAKNSRRVGVGVGAGSLSPLLSPASFLFPSRALCCECGCGVASHALCELWVRERWPEELAGEEEEEEEDDELSFAMCCYVGKATKIFLCLAAALIVVGLVLGFGLAHRTWGERKVQPDCRWPDCQLQPTYGGGGGGDPLPATSGAGAGGVDTPPGVPLTEPAVAAFPGVASASSAAPPTASMPYLGPPSPFAVGLAPAHG